MISYTLTRSNRKTLALYIRNGIVDVRAPLNARKSDIDRFVASKEQWITDKLAKSSERMELRNSFALTYGDHVLYQGKQYPITAKQGNHIGFDDVSFFVPPDLTPDQVKHACSSIYRLLAKRDLTLKTLEYAKIMSVIPTAVRINGAKTRWGSCSAKNSVNFSWRLIMADGDVIDYVVVHELAHIIEHNHSESFWAVVESIIPDHKDRKQKLKELQHRLGGEDWD